MMRLFINSPCRRFLSTGSKYDSLVTWVESQGGRVSNAVAFDHSKSMGVGLKAARDIKPHETLVMLPSRCMISIDDGATSTAVLGVCEEIPESLWALRLGLRLLAERARGPASPWHAYVDTLPHQVDVPMFFAQNEVKALQYPPLVHQVNMRGRFLHSLHQKHLSAASSQKDGAEGLFYGKQADMGAAGKLKPSIKST
mmetsp:Transcript_42417/g.85825  ORF Transcript_42417/g.85825 Transcript_42417/m.85825 type:complete len:198 (+) Transcript_42417:36-629(+)